MKDDIEKRKKEVVLKNATPGEKEKKGLKIVWGEGGAGGGGARMQKVIF